MSSCVALCLQRLPFTTTFLTGLNLPSTIDSSSEAEDDVSAGAAEEKGGDGDVEGGMSPMLPVMLPITIGTRPALQAVLVPGVPVIVNTADGRYTAKEGIVAGFDEEKVGLGYGYGGCVERDGELRREEAEGEPTCPPACPRPALNTAAPLTYHPVHKPAGNVQSRHRRSSGDSHGTSQQGRGGGGPQ